MRYTFRFSLVRQPRYAQITGAIFHGRPAIKSRLQPLLIFRASAVTLDDLIPACWRMNAAKPTLPTSRHLDVKPPGERVFSRREQQSPRFAPQEVTETCKEDG